MLRTVQPTDFGFSSSAIIPLAGVGDLEGLGAAPGTFILAG
jgi:hypothetical protein